VNPSVETVFLATLMAKVVLLFGERQAVTTKFDRRFSELLVS
jgi:hypothetical protein